MDTMFKSGEFARLCHTTKETLRHYERMGVLSPAVRASNGYRLYSLMQIADFSLVSALRGAGLTLAEVRDFLGDPGSPRLRRVLVERIGALEQERRAIEAKQRVLEASLAQTDHLAEWLGEDAERTREGYRWRVRACEEEYFVESAIPYAEDREGDFLEAAAEHMRYCEEQGWGGGFQEAYRIDAAHVAAGLYAEGFCAEARVPVPVDSPRLRVKPAGTYLQLLNRIDLAAVAGAASDGPASPVEGGGAGADEEPNPLFAAYDALRALADERGWRLAGDLYDVVLSTYAGRLSEALYTEVSMLLEAR